MGRKFIIEEVEEESKFGCGSIVATIIIALVRADKRNVQKE